MHILIQMYPPDQPMIFNPQNPNAPPIYVRDEAFYFSNLEINYVLNCILAVRIMSSRSP